MEGDQAHWTFSQKFTSEFRTIRSDLERQLNDVKASPSTLTTELLQSLSADIAKLAKNLTDAAPSLPAYDRGLYETQINDLEKTLNGLRISSAPKPKFTFKRKATTPSSPTPTTGSVPPSTPEPPSSSLAPQKSSIPPHSYAYLTIHSLIDPTSTSTLTISDLDHCILNLIPSPTQPQSNISAIHLQKITNSVLLLPVIKGSVLIHDASRCVIVVGCHQFRMHTSTKVDVFLWIPSNPIIEDCRGIGFATYPGTLLQSKVLEEPLEVPLAVQDFSHIRSTPSPNWVHMGPEGTSRVWPVEHLSNRSEIESSLRAILPV